MKRGKATGGGWLADVMRRAIAEDGRTWYRISKDSGVTYATLHRFASGAADGLNLRTASDLCTGLGLELRPIRKAVK